MILTPNTKKLKTILERFQKDFDSLLEMEYEESHSKLGDLDFEVCSFVEKNFSDGKEKKSLYKSIDISVGMEKLQNMSSREIGSISSFRPYGQQHFKDIIQRKKSFVQSLIHEVDLMPNNEEKKTEYVIASGLFLVGIVVLILALLNNYDLLTGFVGGFMSLLGLGGLVKSATIGNILAIFSRIFSKSSIYQTNQIQKNTKDSSQLNAGRDINIYKSSEQPPKKK